MRTKDRTRLIGVVAGGITTVLAITLAGCTVGEPEPDVDAAPVSPTPTSAAPSPSPTETEDAGPQYSPEEQAAIDAAEAAVLRFHEIKGSAFSDPKKADPAVFDDVAIDPVRSENGNVLAYFRDEGLHWTGESVLTLTEVSSVSVESDPESFVYPKVTFNACLDGSEVDLVDESGTSVSSGEGSDHDSGVVGAYEEPGQGWFVEYWEFKEGGEACAP